MRLYCYFNFKFLIESKKINRILKIRKTFYE